MRLNFHQKFLLVCAVAFLAIRAPAGTPAVDTYASSSLSTNDAITSSLLQIQEQLHTTQLAIEQNQQAAIDTAKMNSANSELLSAQLQALEQTVTTQHNSDVDASHKTVQWVILLTGIFGLLCLGIMSWMVYLQSRAFTQLTRISSQQQAVIAGTGAVQPFAAPGRAIVENSSAQLLDAVGQLKDRINELEKGGRQLPNGSNGANGVHLTNGSNGNGANANGSSRTSGAIESTEANGVAKVDSLAEGQKYLDENAPQKALELFDRFLVGHPDHAEALLKKADALQKIGRNDEALAHYNRVIEKDSTLAVAHLQKGGLLNRLRRYDEALNCYEQALQAQEKRRR
jgi:tetratricopeptide (TPR) repeat protein